MLRALSYTVMHDHVYTNTVCEYASIMDGSCTLLSVWWQTQDDPVDIDKAGFQPPLFMEKVLKECSLNELYHKEERMKKGIHTYTVQCRTD